MGLRHLMPRRSVRYRRGLLGFLRRLLFSFVLAVATIRLAIVALFLTSWPKWLSLLLEPFSLLLAPGVVGSLIFTRTHDYVPKAIVLSNFVLYFSFFLVALWEWDRRAVRRARLARNAAREQRTGEPLNLGRGFK